jgi:predicted peptidase
VSIRRELLATVTSVLLVLTIGSAVGQDGLPVVTAISKNFLTGEYIVAVAVAYDEAIDGSELSPSDFSVSGRTITGTYTSASASLSHSSEPGRFVIVVLSVHDQNLLPIQMAGNRPRVTVRQTGDVAAIDGRVYEGSSESLPVSETVVEAE